MGSLKKVCQRVGTLAKIIMTFMVVSVIHGGDTRSLHCEPEMFAEQGNSLILKCNITGTIEDVYWYLDFGPNVAPFMSFQNGELGGTAFGKGEFELSRSSASLTIINAQIKHEGVYTLVVYYDEFDSRKSTTNLTVYIRPPDLCPVITGCGMPCKDCELIVNGSGELQCTIRGSRPGVPIEWTIKSQSFINLEKIENPPEYNETSQTWISTSIIKYITQGCGAKATLLCNGVQPFEILETPSSQATIQTELCPETTTITSTSIPGRQSNWISIILVMLVSIIVIVILIVIVMFIFIFLRGRTRVSYPETGEQYLPLSTTFGNFMRGNTETVSSKQKILIQLLVKNYRKFCFLKPLPWDEPIPTDALYTPCQCNVSHNFVRSNASNTNAHSSDDLSSPDFRKENKRVLITADLGYGKTTFTQHLVQDWISEESHSYVLVYVQLKDVKRQMSVADVLKNMLPPQDLLRTSDVEDVLRNADCLVLLDGLDELSISTNLDVSRSSKTCASRDGGNIMCESSTLTIGSLLENNTDMTYKDLKVWVTSRDVDDINPLFSLPYTKVKLNGFSERNLDSYIEKTCKYSCDTAAKSGREEDINPLNSNLPEFQKKVTQSIAENDIFEDFAKTPLLLIMIVHIIASRISNRNSRLREVDVNKLTTIIRMVITCLEARYVQKVENELVQKDIQSLETELGCAAFNERGQLLSRNREYWNNQLTEERTEMALSIGLLKLTKDVGVGNKGIEELAFSSHTFIEFYHEFFQDFFTAKFITEKDNTSRLQYAIKDLSDDRTLTFLKFIFGLQKEGLKGACKVLANRGNLWNNLIDCIYEMTDMKEKVEIVKSMSTKWFIAKPPSVIVKYLGRQSHCIAMKSFCQLCMEHDMKLKEMIFSERIAISVLQDLNLPELDYLVFKDMDISIAEFGSIVTSLDECKFPKELKFINCGLPKELSDPNTKWKSTLKLSFEKGEPSSKIRCIVKPTRQKWETLSLSQQDNE